MTKMPRNKIRKFYEILFSGLYGVETDGCKKIPTTPTHQLVAWDIKCEIIQNSLCAQMLKTTRTKLLLYNGQVDEYLSNWNSEGEGYLDLPGVRWSGFTYPQIIWYVFSERKRTLGKS